MSSFLKTLLPILICLFSLHTVYAQGTKYLQHPDLDNIAVNNETLDLEDEANVKVKNGDVVKIAGRGNPENLIGVEVEGKVYVKTIDGNGNWFALFTVQNLENDSYNIEIKYSDKENESLTSLRITDNEENKENSDNSFTKSPLFYILLILAIPLLASSVWFLIIYLKKSKKVKKRI